jgi:Carboxypeptidase regulatory-like domain
LIAARIAVISLVALFLARAGVAQSSRSSEDADTRSVQGVVKDASGNRVENAIVLLKDTKTLQIRSFKTSTGGSYHFAGLSPNVEYQLKANYQGVASSWKTLSIFNTKRIATIDLKLKK